MISALLVTTLLGQLPGAEVGAALSGLRRTFIEDGEDRVTATATHRVISRADGSLELQGHQGLRLSVHSVRREGGQRCLTSTLSRERDPLAPRTVRTLRTCGLEETWSNEPEGLAHAFTVQRAPEGKGDLFLRLTIEGPWHHQDAEGHVFKGPGAAELLRYGNAFVVRGGQRLPISVSRVEGGLELRVPAALLAGPGAFPLHLDPLLSAEQPVEAELTFGPPPTLEEGPALAVNSAGVALVVWMDTRRQVGVDLFGARFNSTGGLADQTGIPIATAPGHQLRPTVCAEGSSFLVAWDTPLTDGGWEIRARTVSAAGLPGLDVFVANGSQPSLASAGDAGYSLLALVDPNDTVQVHPMQGTTVVGALGRPPVGTPEVASRPAITASNRSWFVAWESTSIINVNSIIRGMASGATSPLVMDVSVPTLAPARRPTVALSTDALGDEVWVSWEQGITVQGVRLRSQGPTGSFSHIGASPALVRTSTAQGALPTLGLFGTNTLEVRDLNDGGLISFGVGNRPNGLVLASGGKLYAAWTQNLAGTSDVWGASFSQPDTNNTQAFPLSRAATAQLSPKVALRDGTAEGLAVWIDGATAIKAARVSAQNDELVFSNQFQVSNQPLAIERVDVAAAGAGDVFLVTWRQSGGALLGQLATLSGLDGIPMVLNQGGAQAGAGPAVAWDEGSGKFVVAWRQLAGTEFNLVSRTVSTGGTPSALRIHANGEANEVALTCLRTECLLAWDRLIARDVQAMLIGSITGPLITRSPAGLPAVAHDGTQFVLGWRSTAGLSFAKVDFGTGEAADLQVGLLASSNAQVSRLSLAPAVPPIVSWSELSPGDETLVFVHQLPLSGVPQLVASGMAPALATSGLKEGAEGVVVYQRYVPDDGVRSMRSFGMKFVFPADAGPPDAGVDAGVAEDAGVQTDAGVPADGGPPGMTVFETTGCTCASASASPFLLALFLSLSLRKRGEGRGEGRRSHSQINAS